MSAVLTPASTYRLAARIANDKLKTQTDKADMYLDEKEKLSKILDFMAEKKGKWPHKNDLAHIRNSLGGPNAEIHGLDLRPEGIFGEHKLNWNGAEGQYANMDRTDDGTHQANARAWDDMMKAVERAMDRVSTKLERVNSGMEITKAELEDATARENKAYSKADAIMKELRQG
jgi:hypothetical protein